MAQHGAVRRRRRRLHRRLLLLLAATLLSGCQAPAARVAGSEGGDLDSSRAAVLARQVVADSVVELAGHPLRTSAAALLQTGDTLTATGEGFLGKRVLLPWRGPPAALDLCRPTLAPAALEADLSKLTRHGLQPVQLALYRDGADALDSLERLIDSASCRIDVLMFIWEDDGTGRAIAQHLAAKAAAGVPVRVLVDGGGNAIYAEPRGTSAAQTNRAVAVLARQPNVQVLRTRDGWARFDHRKLVLVDGQVAWTGGRNFREVAFTRQHDVSFTLSGPLTGELCGEFERFWKEQGGRGVDGRAWSVAGNELPCPSANLARLVGTGPLRHDLADALFCAIDHARHHVYLENPYLCDSQLLLRLMRARRRGVDVRVVLTLDTRNPLVNGANRVTANYLLRAGVRVYLHQGPTHVKVLSVDGAWAYLGTGNFDPLSLRHDYELGVAVSAGPVIQEVEGGLLAPDFLPEWELNEPLPVTPCDTLSEMIACLFG